MTEGLDCPADSSATRIVRTLRRSIGWFVRVSRRTDRRHRTMFDPISYMKRVKINPTTVVAEVQPAFMAGSGYNLFTADKAINAWTGEEGYREGQANVPKWAVESEEHFNTFLEWSTLQGAIHEAMEFLRVDGEPVANPHRHGPIQNTKAPATYEEARHIVDNVYSLMDAFNSVKELNPFVFA